MTRRAVCASPWDSGVLVDLGAGRQRRKAVALQRLRRPLGEPVPLLARRVAPEARARVDQDERRHMVRVPCVEGERQVAAERHAPEHDARRAEDVQEGNHVPDALLHAVRRRIVGRIAARVPAQIPSEHLAIAGERGHVPVPHPTARAEAVAEQQRRPVARVAVKVVVEADAVVSEVGHQSTAEPPVMAG